MSPLDYVLGELLKIFLGCVVETLEKWDSKGTQHRAFFSDGEAARTQPHTTSDDHGQSLRTQPRQGLAVVQGV